MTAIILAAGKGERLKPLTTQIPKPLITVAGKTLLQRNIDCLDQSGIKKIIVNGSRMGDQIESFLENHNQSNISFDYINEGEEPLGTAGAIFNIIDKGLINDDHFWVINADIMTNFSFSAIQLNSSVMGHIILVPNPEHNLSGDFCLEGDRVTISGNQRYTFSGISYFSIQCFIQSTQRYFALADLLREHIEKEMITGSYFMVIGWM
ncbi:MAG: mannose-1-phosphate guanylyltransferase [Pseudomonadota bacterium]|nr:MAG: mannose-1-phosphate guanylyltransferase [Pseudomonadota bacterium]